jgi:hypothetical protein
VRTPHPSGRCDPELSAIAERIEHNGGVLTQAISLAIR